MLKYNYNYDKISALMFITLERIARSTMREMYISISTKKKKNRLTITALTITIQWKIGKCSATENVRSLSDYRMFIITKLGEIKVIEYVPAILKNGLMMWAWCWIMIWAWFESFCKMQKWKKRKMERDEQPTQHTF